MGGRCWPTTGKTRHIHGRPQVIRQGPKGNPNFSSLNCRTTVRRPQRNAQCGRVRHATKCTAAFLLTATAALAGGRVSCPSLQETRQASKRSADGKQPRRAPKPSEQLDLEPWRLHSQCPMKPKPPRHAKAAKTKILSHPCEHGH